MGANEDYSFLSVETKSSFVGSAYENSENATLNGQNYDVINRKMLYATYYFLENERIEHRRLAYTILNALSEIGGLSVAILGALGSFCAPITYNVVASRFIKALYYKKQRSHKHLSGKKVLCEDELDDKAASSAEIYDIPEKFTYLEKLDNILWMKPLTCCFRNTKYLKNANIFK